MKKIALLTFLIFFSSCNKDDNSTTGDAGQNPSDLLVLSDPEINLNIISSGELPKKISSITSANHLNNPPDTYLFEYIPNSNKIKKIFYTGSNTCENETNTYYYNSENIIDRVENLKIRDCPPEFQSTTIFKYNYKNGVLKSVIGNNESFIYETFFSYNPNGTIKEFYTNLRPKSETIWGYSKSILKYDNNFNVIEITGNDYYSSTYDGKSEFEHDNKINPLKGLFVSNNFNRPFNNFNYLNNNNVTRIKSDYINLPSNPTINYYESNFLNDYLSYYGDLEGYPYWRKYFINYE